MIHVKKNNHTGPPSPPRLPFPLPQRTTNAYTNRVVRQFSSVQLIHDFFALLKHGKFSWRLCWICTSALLLQIIHSGIRMRMRITSVWFRVGNYCRQQANVSIPSPSPIFIKQEKKIREKQRRTWIFLEWKTWGEIFICSLGRCWNTSTKIGLKKSWNWGWNQNWHSWHYDGCHWWIIYTHDSSLVRVICCLGSACYCRYCRGVEWKKIKC